MASNALTLELKPHGLAIVDFDFAQAGGEKLTWRLDTRSPWRPRAYAYVHIRGKYTKVYLERFVAKAPKGKYVRFRNGVTLDCRKANLEVVRSRSAIFLSDQQLRMEWEVAEVGGVRTSPQRRRTEAWRMWCEGNEPDQIAKALGFSAQTIKRDIAAMAANPLAALV